MKIEDRFPIGKKAQKFKNQYGKNYGYKMRKVQKKHNLQKLTPFSFISNSFRDMSNFLNLQFYHVVKITLLDQR